MKKVKKYSYYTKEEFDRISELYNFEGLPISKIARIMGRSYTGLRNVVKRFEHKIEIGKGFNKKTYSIFMPDDDYFEKKKMEYIQIRTEIKRKKDAQIPRSTIDAAIDEYLTSTKPMRIIARDHKITLRYLTAEYDKFVQKQLQELLPDIPFNPVRVFRMDTLTLRRVYENGTRTIKCGDE